MEGTLLIPKTVVLFFWHLSTVFIPDSQKEETDLKKYHPRASFFFNFADQKALISKIFKEMGKWS